MTPAARHARARWWPAGLAWALWALAVLGFATVPWFDHLLRQAGRPELIQFNASGVPFVLAVVSAATAGAVLASRRPAHPVGWLLLAIGLLVSSNGLAEGYARYGLVARPGALPAASYMLTPTGSLPSPRWRWWARATAAGPAVSGLSWLLGPGVLDPPYPPLASPLAVHALAGLLGVTGPVAFAVTGLAVVVGAGSLALRFRRAREPTRVSLWLRPSGSVAQYHSGAGASHAGSQPPAASRSAPTAL